MGSVKGRSPTQALALVTWISGPALVSLLFQQSDLMLGAPNAKASITRIEEEVQRFWRRHGRPEATRGDYSVGPAYAVLQQPIRVIGQPYSEQIGLLATADLLARYRVMRGETVHLQRGWLCHGLDVELDVERALGSELAGYDLAQFTSACHVAAMEGLQQAERLSERLGIWSGPGQAFASLTPQAIGAVWSMVHRLWALGRLRKGRLVAPLCPRCATVLSQAEATRSLSEAQGCTAWVRLPWDGEASTYYLVWAPAPWMLIGMVALAAHPDANYALVELASGADDTPQRLLLAEATLSQTLAEGYKLVRRMRGRSLQGTRYLPPFRFLPAGEGIDRLLLSKEVPLDRGTGLFPVTPTFDTMSLALARTHGLPVPDLVDEWGNLADNITRWRGLPPLQVESLLVEDLDQRGLLFRQRSQRVQQPQCPYCRTPLLNLARSAWLVDGDASDSPASSNLPWIVGRDRAWGAPLPVWVCEDCGEELCVAGLDDLARRTGLPVDRIDPHRPAVDRLTIACDNCRGTMRRTAAVIDAAFEAAMLPLSVGLQLEQAKQPLARSNLVVFLDDGESGWRADIMAAAALLKESLSAEQWLALTRAGAEPVRHPEHLQGSVTSAPASALRWGIYSGETPDRAERGFLQQLWPWMTDPGEVADKQARSGFDGDRKLLDQWLMARLHETIGTVTEALDECRVQDAAEALAVLVSDFAGWHARDCPSGRDEALDVLSRLLAPFVPHLAEAIYRRAGGHTTESVHETRWPVADAAWAAPELAAQMRQIQRLAALGHTARIQAGVDPDRPVARTLVHALKARDRALQGVASLQPVLAEAIKSAEVLFTPAAVACVDWLLTLKQEQAVERSIAAAEIDRSLALLTSEAAADLASQLRDGLSVSFEAGQKSITLLPDEVDIAIKSHPGWAVASDAGFFIALEVG